ncbi:hypothetical protein IE53DRAFT_390292 [Violaceomyces palustris]|uniref:Uncharacterized protein n=1 Tax=Violaceomyces palustris TaxID=1673888 RepID=A0ACD0NPA6_9BASI|nr:hypothetical protein IE53DRAFT_390292 [Violaceomyces palustris]
MEGGDDGSDTVPFSRPSTHSTPFSSLSFLPSAFSLMRCTSHALHLSGVAPLSTWWANQGTCSLPSLPALHTRVPQHPDGGFDRSIHPSTSSREQKVARWRQNGKRARTTTNSQQQQQQQQQPTAKENKRQQTAADVETAPTESTRHRTQESQPPFLSLHLYVLTASSPLSLLPLGPYDRINSH